MQLRPLSGLSFTFLICFTACELDPDFKPGGSTGDLQAGFTATKQTTPACYAPCRVDFDNTSTGATQYSWDFGDGSTSTEESPSHEFDLGGDYMVTLTARDADGAEDVETLSVQILTPITFQKTFGNARIEWANAIIETADGGYAIAGYAQEASGDFNLRGYLHLLDADGNAVFGYPKLYGTGDPQYEFNAIDQTDDGGFVMTGRVGGFQPTLLLMRTDAAGNVVGSFPKDFVDPGQSPASLYGTAVVQLPDGGFGMFGRSFNYRGGSGQNDLVYFRTNPSGEHVDFEAFTSDAIYSDEYQGNWVFDGVDEFLGVGGSQGNGAGNVDFYIVKFDVNGDPVSTPALFGGSGDDILTAVCINPQGGYAAIGNTNSSGAGESDIFFVKLNANGTPITTSQKTFGGISEDFGSAIQATSDNGFVLIGYTKSFGLGGSDFYLIRLNQDGSHVFQPKTLGGFSSDSAFDIKETSDRGFIIVGVTEVNGSNIDVLVIKTDAKGRVF